MFTVIIAEQKHFEEIENNSLFFKPFLNRIPEDIALCRWNPEGTTLYEAVPDLVQTVGRHKSWRALILNRTSQGYHRNPFDVCADEFRRIAQAEAKLAEGIISDDADAAPSETNPEGESGEKAPETKSEGESGEKAPETKSEADAEEEPIEVKRRKAEQQTKTWSEAFTELNEKRRLLREELFRQALTYPLQRLATCLCYQPDENLIRGTLQKVDEEELLFRSLGIAVREKVMAEYERRYYLLEDRLKAKLRKECLEEMLPGDTGKRRLGSMGINLPDEVYCFSIRETETGYFDDDLYWEDPLRLEYSRFVTRNMYFDKMRFLVADLLPETHRDYRYAYIRFLYNLMVFSVNEVPTGVILPRRLYVLESENDEAPLSAMISMYIRKIENTMEFIDERVTEIKEKIPTELSDEQAEGLFCARKNISVEFNKDFDESGLYADKKQYGYFSDSYGDEKMTWRSQMLRSNDTLEKMVKQPRRSLKKSIDKLQYESKVQLGMIHALNEFQLDDVREYTEETEDEMVAAEVTNIFDLSRFKKRVEEENRRVHREMDRRMKRKTAIALGAICLGLLFLTLIPALLSNHATPKSFSITLIVSAVVLGVLLLALVITVIVLKKPLMYAIMGFNKAEKENSNEVHDAMHRYARYLSFICRIRRGYEVLNYFAQNNSKEDSILCAYRKHRNDLERLRAFLMEEYAPFLNMSLVNDAFSVMPYDYDFTRECAEYHYDAPELKAKYRNIDFLQTGNRVPVDSEFVKSISVRMEAIYENR